MVLPALYLAWRSQSGLLSSSCVIREYFWDWQLQAPLPLRPKPGRPLGTWRLEVGRRRGKRPRLWEGAGKRGSREQEARPQAEEAAGPLAGKANRKDCPLNAGLGARESPARHKAAARARVRRQARSERPGESYAGPRDRFPQLPPPGLPPLSRPRRVCHPPFPRSPASHLQPQQ